MIIIHVTQDASAFLVSGFWFLLSVFWKGRTPGRDASPGMQRHDDDLTSLVSTNPSDSTIDRCIPEPESLTGTALGKSLPVTPPQSIATRNSLVIPNPLTATASARRAWTRTRGSNTDSPASLRIAGIPK
jgi:hypothetical protein